jgi:hypothetical protein
MPYPFKDDALQAYLDAQKVAFMRPKQYFDKYVLTKSGIAANDNHALKSKLGFADAQHFSQAMLDAVAQVASTSVGDDCGEGFQGPSAWENMLAQLDRRRSAAGTSP